MEEEDGAAMKPAATTLYWLSALLFSALAGYRLSLWKVSGMAGKEFAAHTAVLFLSPLFACVVLALIVALSRRWAFNKRGLYALSGLLTLATLALAAWTWLAA